MVKYGIIGNKHIKSNFRYENTLTSTAAVIIYSIHLFSFIGLPFHMSYFYYSEVVVLSRLLINYIVYFFLRFIYHHILFKTFVATLDEIKQNGL